VNMYNLERRQVHLRMGHSGTVGPVTVLHAGGLKVQFPMGSLGFFMDLILPATLCLWG